jgi:ABC-type branched-subunit amino acid transport system ATPase component
MPSASAAEALSATAVTKHFGGLVAVEAMSFQLAEKEVLGLIGPNGSGKTSMMNLISGALRPNSGEIKLYGKAIATRPPKCLVTAVVLSASAADALGIVALPPLQQVPH